MCLKFVNNSFLGKYIYDVHKEGDMGGDLEICHVC